MGGRGHELAGILRDDPCSPYTGFGSMGPDFLFFSVREYGTAISDLVNFIFRVYDALDPLIDFYEENIEPIEDALEDAILTADEVLFGGLFQQLKATTDLMKTTALTTVGTVVTAHADLFFGFYPKLQQGAPETDWYWLDFLHYRRTGNFASEMWRLARGDPDLERYVLGYASHIATDVVGHAFVNAVTGGPFRTHWHRHKLVENWIDAYARNHYPDTRRTLKCLQLEDDDHHVANAISGSYYYRLVEFPDGRLPDKLKQLFARALDNTYTGIPHPVMLGEPDLDSAYRLFLEWFERATTIGDARKPTPVPPPGAAVAALFSGYVSGIPPFPGPPSPGGGGFSVLDILAAILGFAAWVADVLGYTLDWIIDHAGDIVSLPYTEALALLKWLLYQIQKAIWEIYDNLRFLMVLGAYFFPEPGDLAKMPWGQALLNTKFTHLTGGAVHDFYTYPRAQEAHAFTGTTDHHLVYPWTTREKEHAEPAPLPFHGVYPEAFISQSHPYSAFIENLYACTRPYGGGLDATHVVDARTWHTAQFGNAMEFSARLIVQRLDNLPNFNLDADRGYGWKSWEAAPIPDSPLVVEPNPGIPAPTYVDP
jgi:hypothetical protein